MISKRAFVIAYVNLLFLVGVFTFVATKSYPLQEEKRQWDIDFLGITCEGLGNTECGFGTCDYVDGDIFGTRYCNCYQGYTHFYGVCDYQRRPQLNAWFSSFFGGSVGADWFYLYYGGSDGGYPVAGVFKLLSGGGFSFWWLVDWIRVLTQTFPDGNGMRLYENLTNQALKM